MSTRTSTQRQHRALSKSRTGLLLIGITALGLTIFLSALKLPRVSIVAKVKTDEAHVSFLNDWEIYDLPATSVRLVNAERILLDGELSAQDGDSSSLPSGQEIQLRPDPSASSWSASLAAEELRLNLAIPAGADVSLSLEGKEPATLRISITGHKAQGSIDPGAEFQLSCNACEIADPETGRTVHPGGRLRVQHSAQEVRFSSTSQPIVISIRLASADAVSHLSLGQPLQIGSFDVQRGSQPMSAVSGEGSIAYPGLQLKPVPIQAGDFLKLVPAGALSVRRITLGDAIEFEMEGPVKALRSGPAGVTRSRMPTFLQYCYYSDFFQLFFGAAMAIGGALAGALYRLGYLSKPA